MCLTMNGGLKKIKKMKNRVLIKNASPTEKRAFLYLHWIDFHTFIHAINCT